MKQELKVDSVKLSERENAYCEEYIIDLNQTQAAIRAGYAERSARQTAARLMTKDNIQLRVQELLKSRSKRTQITSDWVLEQLKDIHELDVIDIVDDAGNLLPITKWSKPWRMYISGMDVQELNVGDVAAVVKKIKWPDKVKNLELIGRHTVVQAWNEKVTTEATLKVDSPLAERLTNGSKR